MAYSVTWAVFLTIKSSQLNGAGWLIDRLEKVKIIPAQTNTGSQSLNFRFSGIKLIIRNKSAADSY